MDALARTTKTIEQMSKELNEFPEGEECPKCGRGTIRIPKKGIEFCEATYCTYQRKYIGLVLEDVPKKAKIRDKKSNARKYADNIWETHNLNDVTDFTISLQSAVDMMQEYANQEVEKALKESSDLDKPFFRCKCTYPSCNRLSNCRNKNP